MMHVRRVAGALGATAAQAAFLALAPLAFAQQSWETEVPMRDGVKLKTTVWTPGEGSYPVVLARGYSATGMTGAAAWNQAGYTFVCQECRGKGGEDGSRFFADDKDGYDCIEWIARQPWSNGKVAMWGGSYRGVTQWRAAVAQPPALKAIIPGYTSAAHRVWDQGYWTRGVLSLKLITQGRIFPNGSRFSQEEWKQRLMFLPLIDMDTQFAGKENLLWRDYITHSEYDDFWKAMSMTEEDRYGKIRIPVLIVVGWRDYYAASSFAAFNALRSMALSPDARIRVDDGGHRGAPDLEDSIRFLNQHLKGLDTGLQKEPPVKIWVRHGSWKFAGQWPSPKTEFAKFYLSSPDGSRAGFLSSQPPADEPPTNYAYDPSNPVLALGANGSHIYPEVPGLITDDSVDQRQNEERPDVLLFTSPPLKEDTEIVGPIEARLHASSSAPDTDFVVRLIDVYPDGRALNITEGIVRARFREGHSTKPSCITPGHIYEYRIELLPTAVLFKEGHRIRLHVTSSCFPLWDRNLNTGGPIGKETNLKVAQQRVYHDRNRPSHIVLPLISAREK